LWFASFHRYPCVMLHVVLFQPEIPPNTGNIIRLCANAGAMLHLIHPLGFELTEARVKRAGLDYHDMACVREYPDLNAFYREVSVQRLFAISTRAGNTYTEMKFSDGDAFLFGPETAVCHRVCWTPWIRNGACGFPCARITAA